MNFTISEIMFEEIREVLGYHSSITGNSISWKLEDADSLQSLVLTITQPVELKPGVSGVLISVQTRQGYYELHDLTGLMTFEPDEVIFINQVGSNVSFLVVGRQATCSMFANLNIENLSCDLNNLDSELLISVMQLSIAEEMIK